MLALCFLPQLHCLSVSLDIPPAFPMALNDLPSTLQSLRLGAMWLDEMPQQIADCVGEVLDRALMAACAQMHAGFVCIQSPCTYIVFADSHQCCVSPEPMQSTCCACFCSD
jgi:hypothetical protein